MSTVHRRNELYDHSSRARRHRADVGVEHGSPMQMVSSMAAFDTTPNSWFVDTTTHSAWIKLSPSSSPQTVIAN